MKESSFMIVIPMNPQDVDDPEIFLKNVQESEHVSVKDLHFDDDRGMIINFLVDDAEYEAAVGPTPVEIPNMFRPEHTFTEEEFKLIDEAEMGIYVSIEFEGDCNQCFYDQLRIIDAMFPET